MNRAVFKPATNPVAAVAAERWRLEVSGCVQGVGFRPFVYRLATDLKLTGTVCNDSVGVSIEVQGPATQLARFKRRLVADAPPLAGIRAVEVVIAPPEVSTGFRIVASRRSGDLTAVVSPDAVVCDDCRQEIMDRGDRRYRYPFTNCTNCGPRFSIVESLPYDRSGTSMRRFTMCERCREEYEDPANRRFHAQPNACPDCGPQLTLWDARAATLAVGDAALRRAGQAVVDGRIVALKGLGGFQLIVDARNREAVGRLRSHKRRPEKPFAVMYPSPALVERDCVMSPAEREWLSSPAAPILLLRERDRVDRSDSPCDLVAPGQNRLGVMVPSTPLHFLLLNDLGFPVVATSGNLNGEPICIEEGEAVARLGRIAELFLVHDRPIVRQVDDSVMRVADGRPVVMRLGRGLAPAVIEHEHGPASILASGGHGKNAFALTAGRRLILSQHIGDLDSPLARDVLADNIESLTGLYGLAPAVFACDRHPDYATTRLAESRCPRPVRVPHHLAHVLAGMAEHRLEGPVLGVSWDGTGWSDDGTIRGGEFLRVDRRGHRRVAHLRSFRLPGGDRAISEPRRSAAGMLQAMFGPEWLESMPTNARKRFSPQEVRVLTQMLARRTNCPETTSAGRLFDAMASLLDLCHTASYEGQAAIALEQACDDTPEVRPYGWSIASGSPMVVDWQPMVASVLDGLRQGGRVDLIARRIHATLAGMIADVAVKSGLKKVVLGGGCFQNARLLSSCSRLMESEGLEVYWPQRTPINDGGLALGQLLEAVRQQEGSD